MKAPQASDWEIVTLDLDFLQRYSGWFGDDGSNHHARSQSPAIVATARDGIFSNFDLTSARDYIFMSQIWSFFGIAKQESILLSSALWTFHSVVLHTFEDTCLIKQMKNTRLNFLYCNHRTTPSNIYLIVLVWLFSLQSLEGEIIDRTCSLLYRAQRA
jgi:hypothetical protein